MDFKRRDGREVIGQKLAIDGNDAGPGLGGGLKLLKTGEIAAHRVVKLDGLGEKVKNSLGWL